MSQLLVKIPRFDRPGHPEISGWAGPISEVLAPAVIERMPPVRRSSLDVRTVAQPVTDWIQAAVIGAAPPFDAANFPPVHDGIQSFRSTVPARLDVRRVDQPDFSWSYPVANGATVPTVAPEYQKLNDFIMRARRKLDVREVGQPDFAWVYDQANNAVVPLVAPQYQERHSYRPKTRAPLDVREVKNPITDWSNFVSDAILLPLVTPLYHFNSYRSQGRATLDARRVDQPDFAWAYDQANNDIYPTVAPQYQERYSFQSNKRRVLDVREVRGPEFSWLYPTIPIPFDPQYWPAVEVGLHSFRPRLHRLLDVREVKDPITDWSNFATDSILSPQIAPLYHFISYRSAGRAALDVRRVDQPDFSWYYPRLDAEFQSWYPSVLQQLNSSLVGKRVGVDVRRVEQPDFSWHSANFVAPPFNENSFPAMVELLGSVRVAARAALDVRRVEQPIIDATHFLTEVLAASVIDVRMRERAKLDVRSVGQPETAWIFQNLPPAAPFDATLWPAIQELESYRARARSRLDVRWAVTVFDAAGWYYTAAEAIAPYLTGIRPFQRKRLDVRSVGQPETAWIYQSVIAPPPFNSQYWPAIEQNLRSERTRQQTFNVRHTQPDFSWNFRTLDDINVSFWPAIEQSINSYRSGDRKKLDVRSVEPFRQVFILNTRGCISQAELEALFAPTRGQVSWTEFEVPDFVPTPTRGRISWVEIEVPFLSTRGRISWVELEATTAGTRGRVAQTEFEIPDDPGGGGGGVLERLLRGVGK